MLDFALQLKPGKPKLVLAFRHTYITCYEFDIKKLHFVMISIKISDEKPKKSIQIIHIVKV